MRLRRREPEVDFNNAWTACSRCVRYVPFKEVRHIGTPGMAGAIVIEAICRECATSFGEWWKDNSDVRTPA